MLHLLTIPKQMMHLLRHKPWFLALIGLCQIALPTHAQDSLLASGIQAEWLGTWRGDLHIYGARGHQQIPMEIRLAATDSSHRWAWTLVYKAEPEDVRAYELVAIDTAKGHYQIDEKNSILLDAYLYGHTLSSRFQVDNSALLINYHFQPEALIFEVFFGPSDQRNETGQAVEEVTHIYSYPLQGMHRATLHKVP